MQVETSCDEHAKLPRMVNYKYPIIVLFFALSIRIAVAWFTFSDLEADPDSYKRLAVNWATSGTMGFESVTGAVSPTAFRPPLYPWLLSWFVIDSQLSLIGVSILHVALGVATVMITYAIGCKLNLRYAAVAAVGVAIDPLLMRGAQLAMTETLATFLAVLAWWLALIVWPPCGSNTCDTRHRTSKQWLSIVGCSLVLGSSILARPTAAPWAALIVLAMLAIGCTCWKRRVNDCVMVTLGILVCIAPWTLRNYAHFGKPIWATTHGGYTLLLANNPSLYDHFAKQGPSRAWNPQGFHDAWAARDSTDDVANLETEQYWLRAHDVAAVKPVRSMDELTQDQLAYRAATATIEQSPKMFVVSCLYRVTWLWALWPYDGAFGTSELVIGLWYSVMFMLTTIGLWRVICCGTVRAWLFGLTLLISLTIVHAIFWSNMRMRSPAIPCVLLLSAAAIQARPRLINTNPTTINTPPTI